MNKERVFWGVFLVLGAAFILVSKLGYFADVNVFSLVLTVVFAAVFIKSIFSVSFTGMFFSLAFIAIIYSDVWGIEDLTPWPVLGAALLASIGCGMIFGNRLKYKHHVIHDEPFADVVDHEDSERLTFETKFGSSIKYVNTDNFEQANLGCTFGGMKVYFDNAVIQGDNAIINLDCSFGGVELYIPRTWKVVNKANMAFGGISEKNRNMANETTKTVTLYGSANFGGVEIIYV